MELLVCHYSCTQLQFLSVLWRRSTQSHPVSLKRVRQYLETAFAQHFHKLGCLGLIILLHRSSMASNTSWVSLKGKAYHSLVDKESFHVSCTSVWLPTLSVLVPKTLPQLDILRSK